MSNVTGALREQHAWVRGYPYIGTPMVSERMASVRDEGRKSTSVATSIGAIAGGLTAFIALVANGRAGDGLLGSLLGNAIGATVVLVIAVGLGVAFGALVGAFEGVIAFAVAHRSARSFRHLPSLTLMLIVVFALVNFTATVFVTVVAFGISGEDPAAYVAACAAAVMTALAIAAFAHLQSTDWPHHVKAMYAPPRFGSRDVIDITDPDLTLRHEQLAHRVNDRLAEERARDQESAG